MSAEVKPGIAGHKTQDQKTDLFLKKSSAHFSLSLVRKEIAASL